MITGTAHFVNLTAARKYYGAESPGLSRNDLARYVGTKLRAGEIHLGPPVLKAGQRLITIDGGLRYAIKEGA